MRPPSTIVVKDNAGVPVQREPVDALEIVKNGGSFEVSEKEMHEAVTATDGHPVGTGGNEYVEEVVVHNVNTVAALSGEAAKADPKFEADAEAGQAAPDGELSKDDKKEAKASKAKVK